MRNEPARRFPQADREQRIEAYRERVEEAFDTRDLVDVAAEMALTLPHPQSKLANEAVWKAVAGEIGSTRGLLRQALLEAQASIVNFGDVNPHELADRFNKIAEELYLSARHGNWNDETEWANELVRRAIQLRNPAAGPVNVIPLVLWAALRRMSPGNAVHAARQGRIPGAYEVSGTWLVRIGAEFIPAPPDQAAEAAPPTAILRLEDGEEVNVTPAEVPGDVSGFIEAVRLNAWRYLHAHGLPGGVYRVDAEICGLRLNVQVLVDDPEDAPQDTDVLAEMLN